MNINRNVISKTRQSKMEFQPCTLNVINEAISAMEPPSKKRANELVFDSETPSSLQDETSMLNAPAEPKNLQDTLNQIEEDVTMIKTSIEKKKPKITLRELNVKLDTIIAILNKWDN